MHARFYSPCVGRFLSADPVISARAERPQTSAATAVPGRRSFRDRPACTSRSRRWCPRRE
jgi:hypothetical protein